MNMKKLSLYAFLGGVLSLNGCPGAITVNPPGGLYSDATGASPDTENGEETNKKRGLAADVLIPSGDTGWPIIPPSCYPACAPSEVNPTETYAGQSETFTSNSDIYISQPDTLITSPDVFKTKDAYPSTEIVIPKDTGLSKDTYSDSDFSSADTFSPQLPETYGEETDQEIYYGEETNQDSYLSQEAESDAEDKDSEGAVNYPDSLDDLVQSEDECYTIAKEEFSSYSLESAESPGGLELYLIVKYSSEEDCLAFFDEDNNAYPDICTYLYAYFFSDQPFGYFHCYGNEETGVGKNIPDYCYYEIKLPATPKEIKNTAADVVECIYNGLGWN
ncbi:hypothetical protein HZC30_07170 [Candidatus Woesearchaeota archaeon]|nr:hypothetical protein [Candidatus Woesearchaeota archaeon]